MERYERLKDIGSGNFGVAKLVRDKWSTVDQLYAVKYIERGQKIDEHVQREIVNHRSLKHPNIIRFKERDVPSRQGRRFERMDLIAVFDRMRFVEGSRKRVLEKGAMD
ncbi:hypothetical protein F2P56_022251 [Juglans regia]|uniref:non-specific serine/threonine protein kinase n=1 Tax=Juglans regia TaxID=51240 RepID=A0A833XA13_JUGRE|nr:hypothetical protein F2P56_022251 [Juglans regia]